MLETITMAYDPLEDRILIGTDMDKPTAASFWLTRRMTLALLAQATDLISSTSSLTAAATAQDRGHVAAFEREAALSATQDALSPAQADVVEQRKAAAERAVNINIEAFAQSMKLTISGDRGGEVAVDLPRPLFQRILSLIAEEAIKGEWTLIPTMLAPAPPEAGNVPAAKH